MTARAKIEKLTNTWYGFDVFSGALGVVMGGFGFFSLLWAAFATAISLALTFFFGSRLLAKSGFWRFFLMCASGLLTFFGVLGVLWNAWSFLGAWSLSLLVRVALGALFVSMQLRSFRVLASSEVKSYCG